MEIEVLGDALTPLEVIESPRKKRRVKRKASPKVNLGHMPREILEEIFLSLDPQTVVAATTVCRKFATVGTSRFWNRLLGSYWCLQKEFDVPTSKRLALSETAPFPQAHFMSYRHFALAIQEVANHSIWLSSSIHMPFAGSTYLGLALPTLSIRNALARFYPDRQFYLAAYGAEETNFNFAALVLNQPKPRRTPSNSRRSSRGKTITVPRHFFPIGLKGPEEQTHFLHNFKHAKVGGTTDAMLLAQAISSMLMAVHTKSALGRLSIKLPGMTTLPPPTDINRFFIRSTILIARIPSLAIEFKFEDGELSDLRMHNPANPWEFVE